MSTWLGKPLDQYTKEELIEIVIELGTAQEQSTLEHIRQLKALSALLEPWRRE